MTIGHVLPGLARERARAGLTQMQLAERAGVSDKIISRLERGALRGDVGAHLVTVYKIAAALGVDANVLLQPDRNVDRVPDELSDA